MENKKNLNGFTLMEIIVSVAVLAFTSGFILQMFIVANTLNKRAEDIDKGASVAMNYIELYKVSENQKNYISEYFYSDYESNEEFGEDSIKLYKYFNDDWEEVEYKRDINDDSIPENVKFVLEVNIKKEQSSQGNVVAVNKTDFERKLGGSYHSIKSSVYDLGRGKVMIAQFNTGKYFI